MSTVKTAPRPRLGRPSDRQDLIVQELREQIVAGKLAPGSQLPTRESIGQKYGAGANTVQRALDKLRDDGFIKSSGRNGTHVCPEPPHLTRFGVVFPGTPSRDPYWLRFWTALGNEAHRIQESQGRTLPLYYGVHDFHASEDYLRLERDVLSHRLAGIIFTANPAGLVGSPIMDEPGVPRVGIMEPSELVDIPCIVPDVDSFFERALNYLQRQGCRRIAYLSPNGMEGPVKRSLDTLESLGMTTQPFWNLVVHLTLPNMAQNLVRLLMNETQSERPDGLIISDDNFVEYATAGLVAAAISVPHDLQVVAHCNFPWQTPAVVPVQRLGFDAREVMEVAVEYIDAMRRGDSVPQLTRIAARFEEEVA